MAIRNPGVPTIIPPKEERMTPVAAKTPGIFPIKKNVRVTNRAEKGALKGKPIMLSHAGNLYPEEIVPGDESTYLQPGDSMIVPGEVILHNFYNILHHREKGAFAPEHKMEIANKFGGFVANPVPLDGAHVNARNEGIRIVAPPQNLPDLLLQQIDSRGKDSDEEVSVYDIITAGIEFLPISEGSRKLDRKVVLAESDGEPEEAPTKKSNKQ
jgi:hypothetical protein